ncbi:MAG: hypothetical protein JNJ65_03845 [Cyclobacteriaceae bacterium]|nr:hypothetical protein [Cyclobacteriaceae bacterium]
MRNCINTLCFMLILLNGCEIDRNKNVDRSKFQFTIGDDAELFFRNVRQIYYDRASPDGTWQAYSFHDRYKGNERPVIVPVIVINWIKDEAYLLIDTNDLLADEDELRVIISNTQPDTIVLRDRGRERMLEFGSKLFEAIQANQSMQIKNKGIYSPMLTEEVDREAFRVTMADFYRLIRVF